MKELLLITGLSICLLGCNSTRTKYAEPTTFAPYSLATLNVIGDNVSSDFFRLDGAESYIFFTDAFLPIDDTSRKACKTLAKCKKYWGIIHQSRYWYFTKTPTAAGDYPAIVDSGKGMVTLHFSNEALRASRKAAKKREEPKWTSWQEGDTYYVEFNMPLFHTDATNTATLLGKR